MALTMLMDNNKNEQLNRNTHKVRGRERKEIDTQVEGGGMGVWLLVW